VSAAPDLSTARHWLLRTCGPPCKPGDHDPHWHEAMGLLMALRTPPATVVRTGPLVVHLRNRVVTVDGAEVSLSPRETDLLIYLATHLGRCCRTYEILAAVWGTEWITGRKNRHGRRADLHVVTVYANRLRGRLGAAAELIDTSPRAGESWRRLRMEAPR
jgi:DNA-binding response OmpR family regulator